MTSRDPDPLREYLASVTGITVPDDRWRLLAPGLRARAKLRGFESGSAYVRFLANDRASRHELEDVLSVLTVRKTSFFRNPATFEALAAEVLPPLLEAHERGGPPPAIWSAGCATGEEPYSIAMVVRSLLPDPPRPAYVLGTDIVHAALARARKAVYASDALDEIPEGYRALCSADTQRVEISPRVKDMVELAEHNLVRDPFPLPKRGLWDAIFCRNVLIYFSPETARGVLERMHESLVPDGALFLGPAEVVMLWGLEDHFRAVYWGETFYYRKRAVLLTDDETREVRVPRRASPEDDDTALFPRSIGRGRAPEAPPAPPAPPPLERPKVVEAPPPVRAAAPELPVGLLERAETALASGDGESALGSLRAAVARAPVWGRARRELGRLLADRGETEAALAELQAAARHEPLDPRAHLLLGSVHDRRGERDAAEESYRRAIYLDPDLAAARYALAQIYRATGRPDRARLELRNVVRTLRSKPPEVAARLTEGVSPSALAELCERELSEIERGGSPRR